MEMEVVVAVPYPVPEFNFDSTCSSPYMTAPSSPQRFGNYFLSAPTSPTRFSTSSSSAFLKEIHHSSSSSSIPFDWEEKPGTPKSRIKNVNNNNKSEDFDFLENEDFEFDFSGQLDRTSLSADELFDRGKIKPLKPPPGCDSSYSNVSSPKSPKSPKSPFSPRSRKKDFDPFHAAIEETTRRNLTNSSSNQRGRERTISISSSSSNNNKSSNYVHKGSRSLSPLRVSDLILDDQETDKNITESVTTPKSPSSYASSILSAISFSSKGYKKWKLKDLLLFRSASEGRATGKDPLTKYTVLSKRNISEDVKNASFRSTESSVGGSSRRRGLVSAHELHYTANRAVSEELKRKTFLPYKQGLLGCLGFNPGVHEISRGIGSLTRG